MTMQVRVWLEQHPWRCSHVVLPFLHKETAATLLSSRVVLLAKSLRKCQNRKALISYSKEVTYLLEALSTNSVIDDADIEIMRLLYSPRKTLIEYSRLLWVRELHFNRLYHDYVLKGNLIEGPRDSIPQRVVSFGFQEACNLTRPGPTCNIPSQHPEWFEIKIITHRAARLERWR